MTQEHQGGDEYAYTVEDGKLQQNENHDDADFEEDLTFNA